MFRGKDFCVHLVPFGVGRAVVASIEQHGGKKAVSVSASTTAVVCDEGRFRSDSGFSSRNRAAVKLGIPIVSTSYIDACITASKILPFKARYALFPFLLHVAATKDDEAATADVPHTRQSSARQVLPSVASPPLKVPVYTHGSAAENDGENKHEPAFPAGFRVLQRHIAEKRNVVLLELHAQACTVASPPALPASSARDSKASFFPFRVYCSTYEGTLRDVTTLLMYGKEQVALGAVQRQHRYFHTLHAAEAEYRALFISLVAQSYKRRVLLVPPHVLVAPGASHAQPSSTLDPQLLELLTNVHKEAKNEVMSLAEGVVQMHDVDTAESIVLQALDMVADSTIDEDTRTRVLRDLASQFRRRVPLMCTSHSQFRTMLAAGAKTCLARLQALRDSIGFGEGLAGGTSVRPDRIYLQLRAKIERLSPDTDEAASILDMVADLPDTLRVANVFKVTRAQAADSYAYDCGPHRLLFHGTHARNVIGVLHRGILMPKVVNTLFDVQRSDYGYLGAGVYFSPTAAVSAQYSQCDTAPSRVMFVARVAVGNALQTEVEMPGLVEPPRGYNSVVGVASTRARPTPFKRGEEVCVYSESQYRIEYMIELRSTTTPASERRHATASVSSLASALKLPHCGFLANGPGSAAVRSMTREQHQQLQRSTSSSAVQDAADQPVVGLVSSSGKPLPLASMHVRASIVDLASKVVVVQEYRNTAATAIEAKFVFPLASGAGVCGFEAFINGKHIVGEVKEKEVAHREYKAAVAAGKGAYLMDQVDDSPDVFTVSVGNLPPKCTAIIRITYVAELVVDPTTDAICFTLPANVTPRQQEAGLTDRVQSTVRTVAGASNTSADKRAAGPSATADDASTPPRFTLEVCAEMAFNIVKVQCVSHAVISKRVGTKAMLRLANTADLPTTDFEVRLQMNMPNTSRMWIEHDPQARAPPAAMVAFYPRLPKADEATLDNAQLPEYVIFLDRSASMASGGARDTAVCALRCLLVGLPRQSTVQVVTVGSTSEHLFPRPVLATDGNVSRATMAGNYAEDETWGLTDLYAPLRAHLDRCKARKATSPDTAPLSNMFLITDAQVSSDLPALLDLLHDQCDDARARLFVVGVGEDVERHACAALARHGRGAAELLPFSIPDSSLQPKTRAHRERTVGDACDRHLRRAFQPAVSDVTVRWQANDRVRPMQAPVTVPTVFDGERVVVYGLVDHCQRAHLHGTIIDACGKSHRFETSVSTQPTAHRHGFMLHALAARKLIQDYDEGCYDDDKEQHMIVQRQRKAALIRLSKRFQVLCAWTSFVAVEDRDEDERKALEHGRGDDPNAVLVQELATHASRDCLATVPWGAVAAPDDGTPSQSLDTFHASHRRGPPPQASAAEATCDMSSDSSLCSSSSSSSSAASVGGNADFFFASSSDEEDNDDDDDDDRTEGSIQSSLDELQRDDVAAVIRRSLWDSRLGEDASLALNDEKGEEEEEEAKAMAPRTDRRFIPLADESKKKNKKYKKKAEPSYKFKEKETKRSNMRAAPPPPPPPPSHPARARRRGKSGGRGRGGGAAGGRGRGGSRAASRRSASTRRVSSVNMEQVDAPVAEVATRQHVFFARRQEEKERARPQKEDAQRGHAEGRRRRRRRRTSSKEAAARSAVQPSSTQSGLASLHSKLARRRVGIRAPPPGPPPPMQPRSHRARPGPPPPTRPRSCKQRPGPPPPAPPTAAALYTAHTPMSQLSSAGGGMPSALALPAMGMDGAYPPMYPPASSTVNMYPAPAVPMGGFAASASAPVPMNMYAAPMGGFAAAAAAVPMNAYGAPPVPGYATPPVPMSGFGAPPVPGYATPPVPGYATPPVPMNMYPVPAVPVDPHGPPALYVYSDSPAMASADLALLQSPIVAAHAAPSFNSAMQAFFQRAFLDSVASQAHQRPRVGTTLALRDTPTALADAPPNDQSSALLPSMGYMWSATSSKSVTAYWRGPRYVEVTVGCLGSTGDVRLGWTSNAAHGSRMGDVAWPTSMAFCCQTGVVRCQDQVLHSRIAWADPTLRPPVKVQHGDVVGVGLVHGVMFITVNGVLRADVPYLTDVINPDHSFFAVQLASGGACVHVNMGQAPFRFDVSRYKPVKPLSWTSDVQQLQQWPSCLGMPASTDKLASSMPLVDSKVMHLVVAACQADTEAFHADTSDNYLKHTMSSSTPCRLGLRAAIARLAKLANAPLFHNARLARQAL